MRDQHLPYFRDRLHCPGPTPVPFETTQALEKTHVYHRSEEFYNLFKACRQLLAPFFGSKNEPLILTSSGTGAMEAATVNLTNPGDEALVITSGKFGKRWEELAQTYQLKVHTLDLEPGTAPTPDAVTAVLKNHGNLRAVFFQANETSTGVQFPVPALCQTIRTNSQALIIVDAISYLVAHELKMDEWGIDCAVSGSQKGFGVPPGLAFITLSDRAWSSLANRPRYYFDLERERKNQEQGATAYTPAIPLVLALHESLKALAPLGPSGCAHYHERLAKACRQATAALGLELLAKTNPSNALTAVKIPEALQNKNLVKIIKQNYRTTFAGGQDELKGKILRISHLGFIDPLDLIAALAALEFGLSQCNFAFKAGRGVQAAMISLLDQ